MLARAVLQPHQPVKYGRGSLGEVGIVLVGGFGIVFHQVVLRSVFPQGSVRQDSRNRRRSFEVSNHGFAGEAAEDEASWRVGKQACIAYEVGALYLVRDAVCDDEKIVDATVAGRGSRGVHHAPDLLQPASSR